MKKKLGIKIFLIILFITSISIGLFLSSLQLFSTESNLKDKNLNLKLSSSDYANATIISDGNEGIIWNHGHSRSPNIALDSLGNLHVVWGDDTDGIWGLDQEIMYCNYSSSNGWSFPDVISDGYDNKYWNDAWSGDPDIAIDSSNNIHVVWADYTDGIWGTDIEIMYAKYSTGIGWSNVTVISDGYNDFYWNDDSSLKPSITIDNNDKIHVVWVDNTDGVWGNDWEIMYASYTISTGWSNATVISDGYNGIYWNDDSSNNPAISSDNNGKLHVVWEDQTDGIWGTDPEIMYTSYSTATGWANASVISDGHNNIYWNDDLSFHPDIGVDSSNDLHVVWEDHTIGTWGTDPEIMYTKYSSASGWSTPVVAVDNSGDCTEPSITIDPSDNIHVAWEDDTPGDWGTDSEIWYVFYTEAGGWSNSTVISDGYNNIFWNNDDSNHVSIVADTKRVYAVWSDLTNGIWGVDDEIMYTSISIPSTEEGGGIPFGNFSIVLALITMLGLVIYVKKKSNF